MSMILHCGGEAATFEDICSIDVPQGTRSYRPVPHGDLVRLIEEEVETRHHLGKPEMKFGLNREGKQLFGLLTYDLGRPESGPDQDVSAFLDEQSATQEALVRQNYAYSIALRNSYDKTMSVGIAGGTWTFICDNLALSGSDFNVKMKHGPSVWDRLVPEVMVRVKASKMEFTKTVRMQEGMKEIPLSNDNAYRTIGLAQGRGVLTTNQASLAFNELRRCANAHSARQTGEDGPQHTFADFHGSSYALYNHFTEALKLGKDVSRKMDKYTGVSRLFEELELVPDQDGVYGAH
jgi:hypothetical protein